MNPSNISYKIGGQAAIAIAQMGRMMYKPLAAAATGIGLAAVLIGAGCAKRAEVIHPPIVVHPTMAQLDSLAITVNRNYIELQGKNDELDRKFGQYRTDAESKIRELQGKYGALKEGQDSLQVRVGQVEQTQKIILERPLNENPILIPKEKYLAVYTNLFNNAILGRISPERRESARLKGAYLEVVPTVDRNFYNVYLVTHIKETGSFVVIPPGSEIEAIKVSKAEIKKYVPEDVMQQLLLNYKIANPAKASGTPAKRTSPKPFTRTQREMHRIHVRDRRSTRNFHVRR